MDLMPHLEMIQVEKVSALGITYTKLIRIDDLEKVDFESAAEKGIDIINLFLIIRRKLFLEFEQSKC